MGVKIFELVPKKDISLADLTGKKIAIDTNIFLYQFLATIRQPDGSLLTDSKGRVTSHLIGLFSRTANLLQHGIKPCFVLEGKPPVLKKEEQKRRSELKKEAEAKYKVALEEHDVEAMKKYASRTVRLNSEMIEQAKMLISAFGLPTVQAPGEGEAQSAFMAKQGDVWASASQDADSILFGAARLVRNLGITGRRKKPGQFAYIYVKPELIELKEVLNALAITQDQLICLSMLVGTDYNVGGIKGIGPKKALALVKEHRNNFDALFQKAKWEENFNVGWKEIFSLFKNPEVAEKYDLEWKAPDPKEITRILVKEHDFSADRVEKTLGAIFKTEESRHQKGLSGFF